MALPTRIVAVSALAAILGPATALSQEPPPPPRSGVVEAPPVVATGVAIPLRGSGIAPGGRVRIELRRGAEWVRVRSARAGETGQYAASVRPRRLARRYRFRVVAPAAEPSPSVSAHVT